MGNLYELMSVATNCDSFNSSDSLLMNSIGTPLSKSCSKCSHCKDCNCQLDLYDKVVCSLDDK